MTAQTPFFFTTKKEKAGRVRNDAPCEHWLALTPDFREGEVNGTLQAWEILKEFEPNHPKFPHVRIGGPSSAVKGF